MIRKGRTGAAAADGRHDGDVPVSRARLNIPGRGAVEPGGPAPHPLPERRGMPELAAQSSARPRRPSQLLHQCKLFDRYRRPDDPVRARPRLASFSDGRKRPAVGIAGRCVLLSQLQGISAAGPDGDQGSRRGKIEMMGFASSARNRSQGPVPHTGLHGYSDFEPARTATADVYHL